VLLCVFPRYTQFIINKRVQFAGPEQAFVKQGSKAARDIIRNLNGNSLFRARRAVSVSELCKTLQAYLFGCVSLLLNRGLIEFITLWYSIPKFITLWYSIPITLYSLEVHIYQELNPITPYYEYQSWNSLFIKCIYTKSSILSPLGGVIAVSSSVSTSSFVG